MSRLRGNDNAPRAERTPEERERARREREARRAGKTLPPDDDAAPDRRTPFPEPSASGPPADPTPLPPLWEEVPASRVREPESAPDPHDDEDVADVRVRAGAPVRRITPDPPAPPAAPAGALRDETERPAGLRRVRRSAGHRAVVTPPGDVPHAPARARRSMRGRAAGALAVAIAALIVFGVATLFQPFAGEGEEPVRVSIPAGAGAGEIGDILAEAGVIDSGFLFSIRAAVSGKGGDLRSGPHTLRREMSYGAVLDALGGKAAAPAPPRLLKVTLPEGPSRRELRRIVARAGVRGDYLDASKRFRGALNPFRYRAPRGTRSLEGFLFPATYELRPGENARDLVEKQLRTFQENFGRVDLRRARRKNLSAYDVLIIASMVEREAQLARERPLIAAVIYNRLSDGMPLGIDATIRYATNNWRRPLRQSVLQRDTAYNTRKRAGLPPTPIGNPGLSSLRAAARPANVNFLYYVVKPGTCGQHAFSSSDAEFQRDAARYNSARARRNGQSPTNC